MARKHKLTVDQILAIESGNIPEEIGKAGNEDYDEDLRQRFIETDRQRIVGNVLEDIAYYTRFKFNLSYNNGYTFQTTDLQELVSILETEADLPEELTVTAGTLGPLSFRLTLGARYGRTASYTLEGERKDVEHISGLVRNLLKASEPENSWLHRKWPSRVILILTILAFAVAYFIVIVKLPISAAARGTMLVFLPIIGVAGAAAAVIPIKRLQRAFPLCQFEFGPEQRRRGTYRSVLWTTVTIIAVPLLFAWLFN